MTSEQPKYMLQINGTRIEGRKAQLAQYAICALYALVFLLIGYLLGRGI